MRYIKRISDQPQDQIKALSDELNITTTLASLLISRDIKDKTSALRFLNPLKEHLNDPFLFDAMSDSVELITDIIEADVPIAIYSDFDCDGVCGAAILKKTLEFLGADVRVYIPDRFSEGYGTNGEAFEMLSEEVGLIITVDCGITSVDDVAFARDMGVEVVILDHHECGELPDTPYIINPKRPGESYPDRNLCGAGIAFKLSQALIGDTALNFIDIAGVATIGDIVSLTGENRVLASLALDKIRSSPCEGIRQLALKASVDLNKINSYGVSYKIVPRLNVAGRLEHAYKALDLLVAETSKEAAYCAEYLNSLNEKRRAIQKNITELAREQVKEFSNDDLIILVKGKDFHKGVVGLAASSIASEYYKPTIVLSENNGILTGSARSIPGVNIHEIMESASDLYIKFGGHSQAAGVTFSSNAFEEVKERLNKYINEHYSKNSFDPFIVYDESITSSEISDKLLDELNKLEPFGQDNPQPVFLMKDTLITNSIKIGKNQEHSKAMIGTFNILRFNGELQQGMLYDLCGTLSYNEFADSKMIQFTVMNCEESSNRYLKFIKNFLKEACAIHNTTDFLNFEDFIESYAADDEPGVIIVNTEIGEEYIHNIDIPYHFYDEISPLEPCKCVIFNPVSIPQWCKKLYLCASPSLKNKYKNAVLFMNDSIIDKFVEQMKEYYVSKNELNVYLNAFKKTKNKYNSISELLTHASKHASGNLKDMWFALNVFFEQKLIAFEKSDKISLIYNDGKMIPDLSNVYRQFTNILNEVEN